MYAITEAGKFCEGVFLLLTGAVSIGFIIGAIVVIFITIMEGEKNEKH